MKGKSIYPDAGKVKQPDWVTGSDYPVYQYSFPQDGKMCGSGGGAQQSRSGKKSFQQWQCLK